MAGDYPVIMYGGIQPPYVIPQSYIPYGPQPVTDSSVTITTWPAPMSEEDVRAICREEIKAERKRVKKWIKGLVKRLLNNQGPRPEETTK